MDPSEQPTHLASESNTDLIWDDVSDRIERFVQAWSAGTAPEIAGFLPEPGTPSRPFTLIELIKVDLEQRLSGGDQPKSIADYCEEHPEIRGEDGLPVDLIYEELHLRQSLDPELDLHHYLAAYPEHTAELRRMLAVSDSNATTGMGRFTARPNVTAGQSIDDFDLLSLLGQGAFASVFIARQRSMQRIVAVKISADRGAEPQTLARLDHPNIVRIFDQRIVPERGLRLLYMQYIPGGTLRDMLDTMSRSGPLEKRTGRALLSAIDERLDTQAVPAPHDSVNRRKLAALPWHEAVCHLALQVAEAIHYAHTQGVLHRDIKPANILISDSASPKLVDFNISSCSKVEGASATAYFGGSLAYMSPEQMEACSPRHDRTADSLGPPADIYALGVVIWEMLVGSRPFLDPPPQNGFVNTLEVLIDQRLQGVSHERWKKLADHAPPGLVTVLRQCLAPNPKDRFQSAAHLADQLLICLHPQAQSLLSVPRRWIPRLLFRWPELSIVLITILPNALAAFFNYRFNYVTLIEPSRKCWAGFQSRHVGHQYRGLFIGHFFLLVDHAKRGSGGPTTSEDGSDRVGTTSVAASMPTTGSVCRATGYRRVGDLGCHLSHRHGGRRAPATRFRHGSVFSLPGGRWRDRSGLSVFRRDGHRHRDLVPALIRPLSVSTTDVPQFRWVERVSALYLVLAAAVPMLSLGVLAWRGQTDNPRVMAGLSIGGLVIFGAVFMLWRRLQQHFQCPYGIGPSQSARTNPIGIGQQ